MNQILKLYTLDKWSVKNISKNLKIPEEHIIMHLLAHGIDKRKHKNSQKFYLLQTHSESYIKETWIKCGMYEGGEILDCNPKVLYHLARERGWRRPLPDFLAKAVKTGNWTITKNYYIEKGKII